jgi:Fungal N-terminal domain of STAND proteins
MVEPFTIASVVVTLLTRFGTTAVTIRNFISDYREASHDLRRVSTELSTVRSILENIRDDLEAPNFVVSPSVEGGVTEVAKGCSHTVTEMETLLLKFLEHRRTRKVAWAMYGQGDMDKLRRNLEAHKLTLSVVLTQMDV